MSSKTNALTVWKRHFSVFRKFLSDKVATVSWESKTEPLRLSNLKVGHRKLFRKWFWSDLRSKTNVLSIWKAKFLVFCKFLIDEVEINLWESEANYLNLDLVIGSFLENDLIKSKCFEDFKMEISSFLHFLSDEVETIFWESEAKHQKLFKSKPGDRNYLRKWFWSFFELKNQYHGSLKTAFVSFLQISEWRSWNRFCESKRILRKLFA